MELRKRKMRQVLLGFSVLVFVELSSATVVYKPLSMAFADLPAKFAVRVNSSGACGALANADPLNACSPLRNGRRSNETEKARFALIVRGECTFKDKIQNAQNAGFAAAIVYDDKDGSDLISMLINSENTTIHAVFVSKATGELLKEHAHDEEGECCIFPFAKETAWTVLAISFLSFIVILGILLIALFAPRHWLYSQGRNQLPKSVDTKVVEALPCFTFSSARLGECHSEETCAICLENYKDGEILKVLPCQHDQEKDLVGQSMNVFRNVNISRRCCILASILEQNALVMANSSLDVNGLPCTPGSSGAEVVTIDVQEAKDLIKSGYGYMDVRTVEEFKRGYVDAEKIYNIPYMFNTPEGRVKNPDFLKEVESTCNKEDHIIVGCQSGVRSLYAVADLQNVGYKHLSKHGRRLFGLDRETFSCC
ncbi:hypothetical protein ACLB2K_000980 [Fragaria x ananassa]